MNSTDDHSASLTLPHRNLRFFKAGFVAALGSALLAIAISGSSATAAEHCTITGTNAADVLRGTNGPDVICGLGGNDKIYGLGGMTLWSVAGEQTH